MQLSQNQNLQIKTLLGKFNRLLWGYRSKSCRWLFLSFLISWNESLHLKVSHLLNALRLEQFWVPCGTWAPSRDMWICCSSTNTFACTDSTWGCVLHKPPGIFIWKGAEHCLELNSELWVIRLIPLLAFEQATTYITGLGLVGRKAVKTCCSSNRISKLRSKDIFLT